MMRGTTLSILLLAQFSLAAAQSTGSSSAIPPPRSPVIAGAVLSDAVYGLNIPSRGLVTGAQAAALPAPDGYRVVGALNDPASGFQGASYQNKATGAVTVVFRGTDSAKDGLADLGIGAQSGTFTAAVGVAASVAAPVVGPRAAAIALGVSSNALEAQLADARTLTDDTMRTYGRDAVSLAGHSLGGGLAEVESARTGLSANTYNSAGMRDYIAANYPNADVDRIANHNRGDDVVRDLSTQPGRNYVYPSVDDRVVVRGPDGQIDPNGRITAAPMEALFSSHPWDYSSVGANHNIHTFEEELRAGAVPIDRPTYQPLQGEASPLMTEADLSATFASMAARNDAAARTQSTISAGLGSSMTAEPSGAMLAPTFPPIPSLAPPKALTGTASKAGACNKVYKTKDGCHPNHNERTHPGGCHC